MFFRKIKLINKILLGALVITIDVSAIVDVKEVKNQKYLNLDCKYIDSDFIGKFYE